MDSRLHAKCGQSAPPAIDEVPLFVQPLEPPPHPKGSTVLVRRFLLNVYCLSCTGYAPAVSSGRIGIGIIIGISIRSNIGINITINIPITVCNTGNPPPTGNHNPSRRSSSSNNRSRRRTRQPAPPVVLVGVALGVVVAMLQVQYYLHLCTKKSQHWVYVEARFKLLGVSWQTKAGISIMRTLGRVEKFGVLPPPPPSP